MTNLILALNPVAFELFGRPIYWYAICILTGVIFALILGLKEAKKLGLWSDFIYTGLCIILPIAILGARLWYVLFNLDEFDSLSAVLGLDGNGLAGLAIQGGVIAAIISVYVYCKKRNVSVFKTIDLVAPGFLIGQICGRWGNFFNQELYGPKVENVSLFKKLLPKFITDNMEIKPGVYHHPVFLYESILNFIGLILMLILRRKYKKLQSGDLIGFYLIWYGMVRIFTESLRSLSGANEILKLGPIPVSIAISVLFIICGIAYLLIKRFKFTQPYYQDIIKEVKENHVNTLIFDLDGTLIDSRELVIKSFDHVFFKYFPDYTVTDEEMDSFFGPTLKQTFSKFATKDITVDMLIKEYRSYNIAHHDEIVKLFPGTKTLLQTLHNKKYNIAIVSSKKKDVVMKGLDHFGLTKYIDIIIGEEDVEKHKPDPEGINKALAEFTNTNKAVYVGDHPNDILAGKNANIRTCGVLYSSKASELIELEPDYLINKMNDIFKIVCE